MERYKVTFCDKDGNEWFAIYWAEDFAHAEERAYDGAGANPDTIIAIAIAKKHGLAAYKKYGCRCGICREANSKYQATYRAKYGRRTTDYSFKQFKKGG